MVGIARLALTLGGAPDSMKAGVLLATEGCLPSAKGARVRLSNGKVTVVDGPFTESKEVIGGFAVLQARAKDEAIQHVKDFLKVAGDGETEIRELYEAPDPHAPPDRDESSATSGR